MKQKVLVRVLCVVLALTIIGSVFAVAITTLTVNAVSPSANGSGYISDDYVNLRKGAGTNYDIVTCMRKDTKITFTDGKLYNSNWYKITINSNSKSGYVHKSYVKATENSSNSGDNSSSSASGYINDDYVNLRKGAGTNYGVVVCMRKNTKVTFISTKLYNTNWYNIKTADGKTGYVHKSYVTQNSTNNNNSNNNSDSSSTTTGYINDDYVNLRKGAGTNYGVVTCMRKNTKVTFISTKLYNTNWYNIKTADGKTGYVHKSYVTQNSTNNNNNSNNDSNNTSSNVTGYVNDDYVNLRKGAGTNYGIVTCMRQNTQFTYISTKLYNSSWYNIKLNDGRTGYIHKNYATQNPKEENSNNNSNNSDNSNDNSSSGSSTSGNLTISNTNETIYVGNKFGLSTAGGSSVKWSSSNTSVATVDSNGIVTAKATGSTTIKATSGSNTVSCKFTVKSGNTVNISSTSMDIAQGKSVLLKSTTGGVNWKSSNTKIATVKNGIVDTKASGNVTITAYTSSGAATCVLSVKSKDNIRFTYASPNSAPKNSTVTFKAITDTDKTAVKFEVSNGSTSYTVNATDKVKDGNNYVWSGTQKLSASGKWSIKAYSKTKDSNEYRTTSGDGEGEVFVTASTDTTTTVCAERRASDEVIDLIANYEGFLTSVTADYITSDPTLGYGKVVLKNEQFYNNLTKAEAYAYLCQTVNKGGYTSKTNSFLLDNNIKFNQRQFDALVCFTYNVGAYTIYNDSDLQAVLLNTGSGGSVTAGGSGYVNSSSVNLRSGAGTNYNVLTCMDKNTKFTFVDGKVYNSNWYKIKLSNGTVGYIYSSYASSSSGSTRDLNNVNKQTYLNNFLQYHHAAGSCYWGLIYRRIDEAEIFFYGEYNRDGQYNRNNFDFTCRVNSGFGI